MPKRLKTTDPNVSFDARHVRGVNWPDYSDPLVRVNPEDGPCWDWTTALPDSYGSLRANGRQEPAHRFSWTRFRGPIPEGYEIDHLCRRPPCVNPDHLEPVTKGENARRGRGVSGTYARRETCPFGWPFDSTRDGRRSCSACFRVLKARPSTRKNKNFVAPIPADLVARIRDGLSAGESERALAERLGVVRGVVSRVKRNGRLLMKFPVSAYTDEMHQRLLVQAHNDCTEER